ncbi:MAG: hypothetical protein L0338_27805, partial [Acidobacteria bacterium]|nr:hypothetical protein [Acidobacteriota bacterium]
MEALSEIAFSHRWRNQWLVWSFCIFEELRLEASGTAGWRQAQPAAFTRLIASSFLSRKSGSSTGAELSPNAILGSPRPNGERGSGVRGIAVSDRS